MKQSTANYLANLAFATAIACMALMLLCVFAFLVYHALLFVREHSWEGLIVTAFLALAAIGVSSLFAGAVLASGGEKG